MVLSNTFSSWVPALVWLSSITAGFLVLYELHRVLFTRNKLPPGPLFYPPILGDGLYLGIGNPLVFLFHRFKRYGPIYRIKMLGCSAWMLNDPAALRTVFKDEIAEPLIPVATFKELMGDDVILRSHPNGAHPAWRKVFLASLSPLQLAAMVPRVLGVMRAHLAGWEAEGRVPIFRAARAMGVDLAVDVIMQVKLPKDVDRAYFKQQVTTFFDGLYSLHLPLPGTDFSRAKAAKAYLLKALEPGVRELHAEASKQLDAVGKSVPAYAAKLLEAAAAEPPAGECESEKADGGSATSYDPALALAPSIPVAQILNRAAVQRFGLHDAAAGILHMLVGSGDTTRFALFNTWALVSMSPRVQDAIFEEQQQVIAKYGSELSYEAACNMPYMDATLKECMRLMPASGGSMRRLTEDMHVGGYVIPKGDVVWYHAGLLHCTDPALWDGRTDCELPPHMDWRHNFEAAFRPERWLGGDEAARPRSYFTFGSGVHLCAGMNLVYLEIKLLLALVLRKYRLRLQTPDMLARCDRLFPFLVPARGTDTVLLEPRQAPSPAA